MSTILKALRRLEEDSPPTPDAAEDASAVADRSGLPASQTSASSSAPVGSGSPPARAAHMADALRERILAEEMAAAAAPGARSFSAPASAASPATAAGSADSVSGGGARGGAAGPSLALFSTRSVLASLAVLVVAGGLFSAFLVLNGESNPAGGASQPPVRAARTAADVPPVALADGRSADAGRRAGPTDRAGIERNAAMAQTAPPARNPLAASSANTASTTASQTTSTTTSTPPPTTPAVPRESAVSVAAPSVQPPVMPPVPSVEPRGNEPTGSSGSDSLARAAVAPTQSSIAARAELASGSGSGSGSGPGFGDRTDASTPTRPMSARRATPPVASSTPSRSLAASTTASSGKESGKESGEDSGTPSSGAPLELAKSKPRSRPAPNEAISAAGALPSVSTRDARLDSPAPGSIRPGAATSPKDSLPKDSFQSARTERAERPSRAVERIDRRGLPDLTVERTSWHPTADRRSAKIRLEETDELMTLREGDAVGGLVITEISPSAVLFSAGEVEIRRRVGEAPSGR